MRVQEILSHWTHLDAGVCGSDIPHAFVLTCFVYAPRKFLGYKLMRQDKKSESKKGEKKRERHWHHKSKSSKSMMLASWFSFFRSVRRFAECAFVYAPSFTMSWCRYFCVDMYTYINATYSPASNGYCHTRTLTLVYLNCHVYPPKILLLALFSSFHRPLSSFPSPLPYLPSPAYPHTLVS